MVWIIKSMQSCIYGHDYGPAEIEQQQYRGADFSDEGDAVGEKIKGT